MGVVAACTAPCWSLDVHSPPESRTGGNADTQTVLAASAVDKCSRIDGRTRQGTEPVLDAKRTKNKRLRGFEAWLKMMMLQLEHATGKSTGTTNFVL